MSKLKELLTEVKLNKIHVKQLDAVTFQGLVSGMMASSSGRNPMTIPMTGTKSKKKMPIWDRLAKQGLLTKKDLGDDEYEYFLTKKGVQLANAMIDSGDLYNPNRIRFKA
jgi:hypothetical protein